MNKYRQEFWNTKKLTGFIFIDDFIYRYSSKLRAVDQLNFIEKDVNLSRRYRYIDIGSGYGGMLRAIRDYVKPKNCVIGIEFDDRLRHKCNKEKGIYVTSFKFVDGDITTMSHVLEHIEDPVKYLKDLNTKYLFVEVPCCDNPNVMIESKSNPYHEHHFKTNQLMELIEKSGYKILNINTYSSYIDEVNKKRHSIVDRMKYMFKAMTQWDETRCKYEAEVIRIVAIKK